MDDISSNNKKQYENVGTKLSDFKILKELGKGSYGTVYTVLSYKNDNIYVMKKMELNHLKEKQQRECYREVSILRKVNHPNIIKYYSSFLEKENLYIIMEYAESGDLYSLIKHYKRHLKHFEEFDIWRIASEILNGLNYLHSHNIIHRDIKCLNLFLTKDKHVKIGDLGVSTIVSSINALHCTRVGTPLYLSPELIKQIPYDYKVDIWSFGCSLYHLCMLEPPFTGDNLITLGNNIVKGKPKPIPSQYSDNLILFIDKMLSKRPERRPSAKESLSMIPGDIMEKINEANRNKVEIKNRPFSSVGNRIFTVNKDEIMKLKDKNKEEKNNEKENNKDNNNINIINNKNNNNENDIKNNKEFKEEKNKNEKKNKIDDIILIKNKIDKKNSIIEIFSDNMQKKTLSSEISPLKNRKNDLTNKDIKKEYSNIINNISQMSKINFNQNSSNHKIILPFTNKINNKQDKSVRVLAKDFKNELKELQKEINKRTIINEKQKEVSKKENNELNIDNENINMININNKENKIEKNNIIEENNNIENSNEKKININPLNNNGPINLKFPNLNKHFQLNNQIPVNLNGFKRILSSKYRQSKTKSSRPYTANTNKMLSPQKDINKQFRPMTGLKHHSQLSNNIINININFFNIDMNRKFLAPNIDSYHQKDNIHEKRRSNKKRPLSQANINLKEFTNGTNEFIFNKIIKTLEEAKGIKKLTINDIS